MGNSRKGEVEGFTCPRCFARATGPVGDTCPSCGITKQEFAEAGNAVC